MVRLGQVSTRCDGDGDDGSNGVELTTSIIKIISGSKG